MKIEVTRGKNIVEVYPKDLTTRELCRILNGIEIDTSNCWMPKTEGAEGYAAIKEAIRRLKETKI